MKIKGLHMMVYQNFMTRFYIRKYKLNEILIYQRKCVINKISPNAKVYSREITPFRDHVTHTYTKIIVRGRQFGSF